MLSLFVALSLISAVLSPLGSATTGMVPETYASVTDMVGHRPFFIAHRGGSADWPEMSVTAYDNAAAWGVGALEVSVARTKDGKYFGLHDATLDRTSKVTGSIDPRDLTWDELTDTYRNKLNADSDEGEPYVQLAEIFARFARSHVMFVDTKYIGDSGHRQELIDLMLAHAPATHWVLKGHYDDVALTQFGRRAGIATWGYYYARDFAQFDATAGTWDMIGLELSASESQWQQAQSLGKPVVAFFSSDAEDTREATQKGASGVMVRSVPAVLGTPRLVAVPDSPAEAAAPAIAPPTATRPPAINCRVFSVRVNGKKHKIRRCVTGKWTAKKVRAQRAKAIRLAKVRKR